MIQWRDLLAIGVAGLATASVAALWIVPAVYPTHESLGYQTGTVLSYEFRVDSYRARGMLEVQLDRGETVRVPAEVALVPGDRACIRALRRGDLVEGWVVPLDRCSGG